MFSTEDLKTAIGATVIARRNAAARLREAGNPRNPFRALPGMEQQFFEAAQSVRSYDLVLNLLEREVKREARKRAGRTAQSAAVFLRAAEGRAAAPRRAACVLRGDGMPTKKKRLTQREKAERAAIKKQLQADGVLPPDKPRLNRKKFAREVWEDFSEMDVYTADFYLRKAIMATVGPELHEVTSEQVGILKLMKLAVETDRFMQQLKTEGREQYSIGEYVEKVYNPVMNL